jgi:hypothetical protein
MCCEKMDEAMSLLHIIMVDDEFLHMIPDKFRGDGAPGLATYCLEYGDIIPIDYCPYCGVRVREVPDD